MSTSHAAGHPQQTGARKARHTSRVRPTGRLLIATIAAWLAAGVAVTAFGIVVGDAFFAAIGEPEDLTLAGIASFTFILTVLGVIGGAVGGVLEGRALRRRLRAVP